jgi:hypothetical protein
MASVVFADVGQVGSATQFTIQNNGTSVSVNGTGQDDFTFIVAGTPFSGGPVLADFTLDATSISSGACGSLTCPTGDTFTEQGFTGSFQYTVAYTVANGPDAGGVLLSGTFSTNATPTNSGASIDSTVNGTGGDFSSSDGPSNLTAIVMNSAYVSFSGTTVETADWAFSGLTPEFEVDPTSNGLTFPQSGTAFDTSTVATFSSQLAPSAVPEPGTLALLGFSLAAIGLVRRRKSTSH